MVDSKIYLKNIDIEDGEYLKCLFQNQTYEALFYEEKTTVEEWKERIEFFYSDQKKRHFIIKTRSSNKSVGWVGYSCEEDYCMLDILVIDECHLRRGYGSEVMLLLKNQIIKDGMKHIKLSTQEANGRAQCFYQIHGFSVTGTIIEEVNRDEKSEVFVTMECIL